jgi:hypothetical protein
MMASRFTPSLGSLGHPLEFPGFSGAAFAAANGSFQDDEPLADLVPVHDQADEEHS